MRTHLLIDGDIIAFIAAAACQDIVEDSFGYVYPFANKTKGQVLVDNILFSLEQGLRLPDGDVTKTVVLSDPEDNWRKQLDPTYKGNRDPAAKPLLLGHLKQYLRDAYGAFHWPSLEADDTLGILATAATPRGLECTRGGQCFIGPDDRCPSCKHHPEPPRTIIVGRDKDFRQIPGLHHQWKDLDGKGKMRVREVSPWEATRWHLIQTLAGDPIDGYAGCPGLGVERASKVIDSPVLLVPQAGVKTRGVNKGEEVTRWFSEPTADYWACIASHYRKAGLTEEDALLQARLANILHHDQYDRSKEAITLWEPGRLRGL